MRMSPFYRGLVGCVANPQTQCTDSRRDSSAPHAVSAFLLTDRWPGRKLRLHYQLALHSAVAEPATIATMEGVSPRRERHKLRYRWNSFFELEAVLIRTEDEARIGLLIRSIWTEINLEAVRPVERRNPQLHFLAPLYQDR